MKEILAECARRPLHFSSLEWWVVDLPQHESFRSALGYRMSRQGLYLRVEDADGVWGIGESGCRPDPYFSHEYLDGAVALVRKFLQPVFAAATTYGALVQALHHIRGWHFTKAALLDAVHDYQRRKGLPDPLELWPAAVTQRVPVGISLGIFESESDMMAKVDAAVAEGYRRIKLKIAPHVGFERLAAVRRAFPRARLAFDGNGSFDESGIPWLARLAELDPVMVEQPFAPDRLDLCVRLKQTAPALPLCLDESINSPADLRLAHQLGALDEVNITPGKVGGVLSVIEMGEFCRDVGLPAWVGGMFETGVGRAHNLRVAARFPAAAAHDLSPASRYFPRDITTQPLHMVQGTIALPEQPVTLCEDTLRTYRVLRESVRIDHA